MTLTQGLLVLCFWLLPFSFEITVTTHRLTIPTEPLLILIATTSLWWIKTIAATVQQYRKSLILILLFIGFIWSLIATLLSADFVISLKYITVQFLHFYCFCLLPFVIYRHDSRFIYPLFSGLFVTVSIALGYIWWHHYSYDLRPDTAQIAGHPFFTDHTHYGLFWLLMIPFALTVPEEFSFHKSLKWFLLPALLLGVFLSFSRAIWITAAILGFLFIFYHFAKLRWILALGLILLASFIFTSNFESSKPSRSESTIQLIKSLKNLSEDVSVRERLNRYMAAIHMGIDRPIAGFGPGTYPKYFIPFQESERMTRISVTTYERHETGRGGSAHSEYLRTLAEEGFPGLILWILIIVCILSLGISRLNHEDWLLRGAVGAVLIFAIHGLFNNHFHDDKIAAIFWLAVAIIINKSVQQQRTIALSHA